MILRCLNAFMNSFWIFFLFFSEFGEPLAISKYYSLSIDYCEKTVEVVSPKNQELSNSQQKRKISHFICNAPL